MLVKITKYKPILENHPNIEDDFEFVGQVSSIVEGESMCCCNDKSEFYTSPVLKVEEFEGYKLVTTKNSVYKIENAMPSIGGVQEKYSLKKS